MTEILVKFSVLVLLKSCAFSVPSHSVASQLFSEHITVNLALLSQEGYVPIATLLFSFLAIFHLQTTFFQVNY